MSRTFEALRKAERERKEGRRERPEASVSGRPDPERGTLAPPPDERQRAALDLDRGIQDRLEQAAAPVLLIPAAPHRLFAEFVLDTVCTLTLRLGLRCLLVDAGLRNPHLHRFAGVPRTRGLADLLGGRHAEVRHLAISGTGGTVAFLPAGGGRPADEAWAERLRAWLDDQSRAYDRVFLVGPGMDEMEAQVSLVETAAGTVLVVPSGKAGVRFPGKVEEIIGMKMLGIVAIA